MLIQHIFQQKHSWLKLMGFGIAWWGLCIALLMHYGVVWKGAVLDSSVFTLFTLLGFTLLENVFRFYTPSKGNKVLIVVLPLVLTLLLLYTGDALIKWITPDDILDVDFLNNAFVIRGVVFLLLFISFSVVINYQGNVEEQAEAEDRELKVKQMAKEAELFQLRQQLQPHFLFNSLNSISALVKVQPEQAREMVLKLSEFLRGTISKEDDKWMSIADEIKFLRLFTDIEKVRFGHRLEVSFHVEEGLEQVKIPQLMIQPLLENAIKHSLYGLTGEVAIALYFERKENNLQVYITNPYDAKAAQAKGKGFGLEALSRRLFLIFGRYDLLKTNASSEEFTVELLIPQHR